MNVFTRRVRRVLTTLALAPALAAGSASAASAAPGPFPLHDTFRNATTDAPWILGGQAILTAAGESPLHEEGEGWLRLTPAVGNANGYAVLDQAFPSDAGLLAEFDFRMFGGTGADGISFFLIDGATSIDSESGFTLGAFGGSLGYTSCSAQPGLTGAYVGVGLDRFGNFSNLGECSGVDAGTGPRSSAVTVRGAGPSYPELASMRSTRLTTTTAQRARIVITPDRKLNVTLTDTGTGATDTVVTGLVLPAAVPATLKLGFAASTGGSHNNHYIRDLKVVKPVNLNTAITDGVDGASRDGARAWTATVTNDGPNPATSARTTFSTGQDLSGWAWTCTASGGADCATASGTGLGPVDSGEIPVGGALTYTVTAIPDTNTNWASLTVAAEPLGDTGEVLPNDNTMTDDTWLTPIIPSDPIVAHPSATLTSAISTGVRGGSITSTRQWQRCSPDLATCTDIPGATGLSYSLQTADRGYTIRIAHTATNAAGSATRHSAALELPQATITSQPDAITSDRQATVTWTATGSPGTFNCRFNGGSWTPCTTPYSITVDRDGEQEFEVVAVRSGLWQAVPQQILWKVDTSAPSIPVLLETPEPGTTSTTARFVIAAEPDAQLECALDDGDFVPCTSHPEFTGLTVGEHEFKVRQRDLAGLGSEVLTYRWTVTALPAVDPGTPVNPGVPSEPSTPAAPSVRVVAAPKTVVSRGTRAAVGCRAAGTTLERCEVKLFASVGGKRVVIGSAVRRPAKATSRTAVTVTLNATGRRLLSGRAQGLVVRVEATATPTGGAPQKTTTTTRLYPAKVNLWRIIWPFDSAEAVVTPHGRAAVRALAKEVGAARRVTCIGHTDSRGSAQRNLRLGLERARAACAALRKAGVDAKTAVQSWGAARPRASNRTAEGRRLNRRVEVVARY